MRHFTLLFTLLAFCLNIFAQDDDLIKVETTIVRLNIGVSDRQGRAITTLDKENFTVFEDGVRQNILSFKPTVTPFSVVLLLDMSGSTRSFRQNIQQSAYRFVDTLSPDDRIAVIEFYDKVNLRNDFTSDRRIIANSISVANGKGKTQFYKALELALEKLSKEKNRRKAIICLTDGIDTVLQDKDRSFLSSLDENQVSTAIKPEQNETLIRVLNNADAQGVTVFPIALPTGDPKRLADPTLMQYAMYSAARSRMQTLADRSGGKLNVINRLEELGRFFGEVAADLRSLYTIEYQPTNDKRDGKFRSIKIEVDRPELIARTRQGYIPK
jgi:Ca-activated chloride channel homolog